MPSIPSRIAKQCLCLLEMENTLTVPVSKFQCSIICYTFLPNQVITSAYAHAITLHT